MGRRRFGCLRITLFGNFRVSYEEEPCEIALTRTAQALLAFLLLNRQRLHSREVLAGLFWGDHTEDQARNCLSTALWRLRRLVEPDDVERGTYLLATPNGDVGFNERSDYWLDVAIFEQTAGTLLSRPSASFTSDEVQSTEHALTLYRGELLEGFQDEWALSERERLHAVYMRALGHLMAYHRREGDLERSLLYGQRILRAEPLREEVHRDVMRLYAQAGQRALAAQQYELCRQLLLRELGIEPMIETQSLIAEIMRQDTPAAPALEPPANPNSNTVVAAPSPSLQQALDVLRLAQGQLQRAIAIAEQLLKGDHTPGAM